MRIGIIIFVASFILQILLMHILLAGRQPELFEQEEIAVNLLTKHTFMCHRLDAEYYSCVPPLYPLLYASVYFLTNYSSFAMQLVQIAFFALTCVIVYLIGKEIFNKNIGIVSAVLCILHPGLIIFSTTKLHELSFVTFLFSLLILLILKFDKALTYKRGLIIGLFIGICILTRATAVLFIPLFLFWILYKEGALKINKDVCLKSIFIISVSIAVISPWIIRNYYVHHKFVFMQTPSFDLWVGNNINSTGSCYLQDGRMALDLMPEDFINQVYAADELTQDRIFKTEVYKFIKAHPYKFILLFFKKLYYFWWFSPQTGIKYPHIYLAIYKALYFAALFFAIWGIIFVLTSKESEAKRKTFLLLLFFLAISVIQSIVYVEGRHRWTIEPLLLIFTAKGLTLGMNTIKGGFRNEDN